MKSNLETVGLMGEEILRKGIEVSKFVVGMLVFPSYARFLDSKMPKNLTENSNGSRYTEIDGSINARTEYADAIDSKRSYALIYGGYLGAAALASQIGYLEKLAEPGKEGLGNLAMVGSAVLATQTLSGLYEWFRATKRN